MPKPEHRSVEVLLDVSITATIVTEKVDTNTAELTDRDVVTDNVANVQFAGTEEEAASVLRVLAQRLERDQ